MVNYGLNKDKVGLKYKKKVEKLAKYFDTISVIGQNLTSKIITRNFHRNSS